MEETNAGALANHEFLRGELDELKCIAKGGMSHIFRARQPSLGRYIVVKKLKDELVGNPEMHERFRREARALASILHQNVAHVYDFVEGPRESYIVMEYIDGLDVSEVIEKMGNIPARIAAAILLGVARGINYLHAHHLIHRDIKPANIRLTTRGGVKLMDFGIVMDSENQGLTRPGMMVGSPSYLSPEQVLGDLITPRADIFLLGIVLYEMLTGSRPFKDEAGETVFQRIREARYIPLKEMQSTVPVALDRITRRCLQKDPKKRFQSAQELVAELENYLGAAESAHTEDFLLKYLDEEALLVPSVAYRAVESRSRTRVSAKLVIWGAVAVAFLSVVLAFSLGHWWASHAPEPPPEYPPAKAIK